MTLSYRRSHAQGFLLAPRIVLTIGPFVGVSDRVCNPLASGLFTLPDETSCHEADGGQLDARDAFRSRRGRSLPTTAEEGSRLHPQPLLGHLSNNTDELRWLDRL